LSLTTRLTSVLCLALAAGCAPRATRLQLQEVDAAGQTRDFFQDFEECYYALTPAGNLNVVMRSQIPSTVDPSQIIEQVVHLHCFWRPVPGTTYAEESMINGYACYMIKTGRAAVSYEGGMFATFKINPRTRRITGKLESSELKPLRRQAGAKEPFGAAFAKGTFVGIEHPRRVTGTLREMERLLGPRPEPEHRDRPFVR
jgi:hypothetical protein